MPQARRDPSCATTMIPNPVDLRVRHFPLKRDPSKYQVADSMASVCGEGVSQPKQPSSCDGGAGTRKTRSPLLRRKYRLIPESRDISSSAPLGASGQPPTGVVNLQLNRCSRVPSASRQIWHRASVMLKLSTCAFLVCDHWPPERAEASSPLQALSQPISLQSFGGRPLISGASKNDMSTKTVFSHTGDPTSQ